MSSVKVNKDIISPRKKIVESSYEKNPVPNPNLPPLQKDARQGQKVSNQHYISLPPLNKDKELKFKYLLDIQDYEIIKNISTGKFGIINIVKNKKTGEEFATKTNLVLTKSTHPQLISREINALIRIRNPTIIRFYGFSFHDFNGNSNLTVFMDYMFNGSLSNLLKKENKSRPNSIFSNTYRQILITGISYGMMVLHDHHIIHRNLKLENILLDKDFKPYISEFGLNKLFDPHNLIIQSNSKMNSVPYIAPEIFKNGHFSPESDVYSFGILMYEIILGTRAYADFVRKNKLNAKDLSLKIIEGLRPEFKQPIKKNLKIMIEKCWSENPNDRPTFREIFSKLSLSQEDYFSQNERIICDISNEEEDGEFSELKYCLDDVDIDKFLDYVDEISQKEKFSNDDDSKTIRKQMNEINNTLKAQEKIISELTLDNSKLRNENQQMKIRISYLEQQFDKSLSIEFFNNLPPKYQQSKISEIISNMKPMNPFFSKLNDILLFLLLLDQKANYRYLEIKCKNTNQPFALIKTELPIYLSYCATNLLVKTKSLNNSKFLNILNKFGNVLIEIKYPSESFNSDYNNILKIINSGNSNIKIAVYFSIKGKTDFKFQGNQDISYIKISPLVTQIEKGKSDFSGSFSNCTSLTGVEIGKSVVSIGNFAFSKSSSLENIDLPYSVKSIGESSFCYCTSLKEIRIPSSVTTIEKLAFSGCSLLNDIVIPNSVKSIGESCFASCSSLTRIEIHSSIKTIPWGLFYGCSSLKDIVIPSSVNSIEDHAFYGCYSLKEIKIPSSIISIGGSAFFECSSLIEVEIPSSVKSIGEAAFSKCTSLTKVEILSSLTTISDLTFSGCSSLTLLEIPPTVISIEFEAFKDCSSLIEVRIPPSVNKIGDSAFLKCASVVEVDIGSCVQRIGEFAFCGCSSLKDIKIPPSVSSIGNSAFDHCSSLIKAEIPSSFKNTSNIFPKKTKICKY